MAGEPLVRLDDEIWVAARPLKLRIGDIGCRMTVVRLPDGGLWLHSPVPLDQPLQQALFALGPVRYLVGPSLQHHLFLASYSAAFPGARLVGAPGLAAKRRDLPFEFTLGRTTAELWRPTLRQQFFAGAPRLNEVVFCHRPSRTLILCDLAFNVPRQGPNRARLFHRLVGATGRFGPHRLVRACIRRRHSARRSLARILAWDFDRVIVAHGEVLESGGHAAMEQAFAYLCV